MGESLLLVFHLPYRTVYGRNLYINWGLLVYDVLTVTPLRAVSVVYGCISLVPRRLSGKSIKRLGTRQERIRLCGLELGIR